MKNKVIVLQAEDWEMLYINGILRSEGHTLNGGEERLLYFIEMAEICNFDLKDVKFYDMIEIDRKDLEEYGNGEMYLKDYIGNYK